MAHAIGITVHTHRCEMLELEVNENSGVMDFKTRVEGLVGEGPLFRITGRKGNPSGDTEFKLVFHGQVLEDYDSLAFANLSRLAELRPKFEEKERQFKAAQEAFEQFRAERITNRDPDDHVTSEADEMKKQIKSLKKERDEREKTIQDLEKRTTPKNLKDYYMGNNAMVIITPARARLGIFGIRVNYIGETLQVRHSRCECVGNIVRGLRSRYSDRLPKDSDDFKIQHALYWRCAPTKMVRLDPRKCLCEYGILDDNTVFEHEIEKIPVSSLARNQLGGIKRRSKLKSLVALPREGRSPLAGRRSKSLANIEQLSEKSTIRKLPRGVATPDALDENPPPPPLPHEEARRSGRASRQTSSRARVSSSMSTSASSPHSSGDGSSSESEEEVSIESPQVLVGSAGRSLRPSSGSSNSSHESHRGRVSRSGSTPASLRLSPTCGPPTNLVDAASAMNIVGRPGEAEQGSASLMSMLKDQEKVARREARNAKKACKDAKKAMKEAERQRRAAESQAARAQAMARIAADEIEQAHLARKLAEKQIREHAHIRMENILKAEAQNASAHLPPIEMKPECVVCMDAPAEVMAYPCGHRCYCISCADLARSEFAARQLARGDKKCTRCPCCREPLENLVRVY
mmetsp:Transcript_137835/g.239563  ORF Transcript_137835/g.239563 Transcript_137835/m.239563 type:complete len:632 (-) Transcript_137835:86-1981(-)